MAATEPREDGNFGCPLGVQANGRFRPEAGSLWDQSAVYGTPRRVRMADADEPWMRKWIISVADDIVRQRSGN